MMCGLISDRVGKRAIVMFFFCLISMGFMLVVKFALSDVAWPYYIVK